MRIEQCKINVLQSIIQFKVDSIPLYRSWFAHDDSPRDFIEAWNIQWFQLSFRYSEKEKPASLKQKRGRSFNGWNEIVTRNVFIALSRAFWNGAKGRRRRRRRRRRRDITHLGSDMSRETSKVRLLIGLATGTVQLHMTNYCRPGSVPSSLPLHAFPPVISHASTNATLVPLLS